MIHLSVKENLSAQSKSKQQAFGCHCSGGVLLHLWLFFVLFAWRELQASFPGTRAPWQTGEEHDICDEPFRSSSVQTCVWERYGRCVYKLWHLSCCHWTGVITSTAVKCHKVFTLWQLPGFKCKWFNPLSAFVWPDV